MSYCKQCAKPLHPNKEAFQSVLLLWVVLQSTFLLLKYNGAEGMTCWMAAYPTFGACAVYASMQLYFMALKPFYTSRAKVKNGVKKTQKVES